MRSTPDAPPFEVRETFWGYVIRGTEGPPVLLQVAQGLVLSLGAALTAAALLLVVLPAGGANSLHGTLALLLGALAALLLWFATRGAVVELQVDLAQGELREIVRHRAGRATVLGRHGFGAGLALSLVRGPDGAALLLRRGTERDGLCIATGPEGALIALRRRLEGDLMVRRPDILLPEGEGRAAA